MAEHSSGRDASVEPYTALAAVYDLAMQHVDYGEWAKHVHDMISLHAPGAEDVLEVGCGTGSLAQELLSIRPCRYLGTDASAEMIRKAHEKRMRGDVQFAVADFRNLGLNRSFDVALLLYDGVNYLLQESDIERMLGSVRAHLRNGGLFVMDQSTPANSINNDAFFEDSGGDDTRTFVRTSEYDGETRLHHTRFEIEMSGAVYHEHHIQRAYTIAQMRALIGGRSWRVVATLDGFTDRPATEDSERVHWILRAA